jgi:hypothetical protein
MAHRAIRAVLDGMSYPAGPRWHDGRVDASDFSTGEAVAVDLDGGATLRRSRTSPRSRAVADDVAFPDGTVILPDAREAVLLAYEVDVPRAGLP